jgi:hypothetical protein
MAEVAFSRQASEKGPCPKRSSASKKCEAEGGPRSEIISFLIAALASVADLAAAHEGEMREDLITDRRSATPSALREESSLSF